MWMMCVYAILLGFSCVEWLGWFKQQWLHFRVLMAWLAVQHFGGRINTMWMLLADLDSSFCLYLQFMKWELFLPTAFHCLPMFIPRLSGVDEAGGERSGHLLTRPSQNATWVAHWRCRMLDQGPVPCHLCKCGILGGLNVWAAAWVKLLGQFNSAMLNFN